MGAYDPLGDWFSGNNVLLENSLATFRRDGSVPDAFGINEKPRSADTDLETPCLCPQGGEVKFSTTALEIIPSRLPFIHRRTIGAKTQEEVPLGAVQMSGGKAFIDGFEFGHAF